MFQYFESKKIKDEKILIYNYQIKEHKLNYSKTITNKWMSLEHWSVLENELTKIVKNYLTPKNSDYDLRKKYIRNLPGDLYVTVVFNEVTSAIKEVLKLENNNSVFNKYLLAVVENRYIDCNKSSKSTTSDNKTVLTIEKPLSIDRLPISRTNSKEYSPTRSELNKNFSYIPTSSSPVLQGNQQEYVPTPKHKTVVQRTSEYVPKRKNSDDLNLNVSYTPTKISKPKNTIDKYIKNNHLDVDLHNNNERNNISELQKLEREFESAERKDKRKQKRGDNNGYFDSKTETDRNKNITKRKKLSQIELFGTNANNDISDTETELNKNDNKTLRSNLPRRSKPDYSLKEDNIKVNLKKLKRKDKKNDLREIIEEEYEVEIKDEVYEVEIKEEDKLNTSYGSNYSDKNIFAYLNSTEEKPDFSENRQQDGLGAHSDYDTNLCSNLNISNEKFVHKSDKSFKWISTKKDGPKLSRTCEHVTIEQIANYYYTFENKINNFFTEFKRKEGHKVTPIQDISYLFVHDMFVENQLEFMLNLLNEKVSEFQVDFYSDFIYYKILPEWGLDIFLSEYKITREKGINDMTTEVKAFKITNISI